MAFTTSAAVAAAIGAAALAGGGTAVGMSMMNKNENKPAQSAMPAPIKASDAKDAAKEGLLKKKRQIEGSKTIFTDPLGLSGQAQVVRKTLLGE